VKSRYLSVILIAFEITSCSRPKPKQLVSSSIKDTVAYSYKTFKQRDPACSRPDSDCAVVSITYPVFNNLATLNDSIKHKFHNLFWNDKNGITDTAVEKYANYFINASKKDTIRDPDRAWSIESSAEVISQDSCLIGIYFSSENYAGGARSFDEFGFINWDRKNSQIVKLKDVLIEGYEEKLTKIAEGIFRKKNNLSVADSLNDVFFKDGKFFLTNNFLITKKGLTFLFSDWEINPFTELKRQIDIPYSQIKSLLRPNTVVAQYIK
jgi:hypothetical protein